MLRHIFLAALLIFSSVSHAQASSYHAHAWDYDEGSIMPSGDNRPVPWPWTLAQPFPWDDIQGLWKVEQDNYVSYFAFKVVKQASGGRQLLVRQIDGETRRVLAEGPGFERDNIVFAQMTSCGGATYRLKLTSFKREDSPQPPVMGNLYTGSVMVLSMSDLGDKSAYYIAHLQLTKVSSRFRFTQDTCLSH
ncbi:hypothetical protein ACLSU7_12790 [Bdellovibrio sp. HCB185ZH]|uniref:hypothetical protein n=1 Tax=Bdellovibrio sp. HCB185ZH TaxID=3394235 RepID=UPI0039A66677